MKQALACVMLLIVALGGCRERSAPPDAASPRIVSCAPALTEMLFSMGLGDHVVGVTSFCQLPEGVSRPIVGNRAQPASTELLLTLRPDLVLIQQNPADFQAVGRALPQASIEHFVIEDLQGVGQAIERLGRLTGHEELATEHRASFERRIEAVRQRAEGIDRPTVYFLTGVSPLAVAGRDSFIHELIELAGGQDLSGQFSRWGQINVENILRDRPEVIIAQIGAADGSTASEAALAEARSYLMRLPVPAAQNGRVYLVTDRHWTIPSPRLGELAEELFEMLHGAGAGAGTSAGGEPAR